MLRATVAGQKRCLANSALVEKQLIERMALYASQLTAASRAAVPAGAAAKQWGDETARSRDLEAQLASARAERKSMAAAHAQRVGALEAQIAAAGAGTPQQPQRARQNSLVQQLLIARASSLAPVAADESRRATSPGSPWAALLSDHNRTEEEQRAGAGAPQCTPLTPLTTADRQTDAKTARAQLEQLRQALACHQQRVDEAEKVMERRARESTQSAQRSASALAAATRETEQLRERLAASEARAKELEAQLLQTQSVRAECRALFTELLRLVAEKNDRGQ